MRVLAAIGCRIVLHSDGTDDLSSWGYPARLLMRAADQFDAVTFVGAGHAIRRAAWDACGGYDDALYFCWEEFDFCLRAIEQGWHIRYCGDIVVRHKVSAERRFAWSGTRWFHFVRNRLYIGHKWSHGWLPLVPRYIFYLFRGARNGVLGQTLHALPAALAMSRGLQVHHLSAAARRYLYLNDTAYRRLLPTEVFHLLPGADSRSRSNIGMTAGLSTR